MFKKLVSGLLAVTLAVGSVIFPINTVSDDDGGLVTASAAEYSKTVSDGATYNINVGDTLYLSNPASASGATYYAYNWFISDSKIASESHTTNSSSSTVTALKAGTVTMQATLDLSYSYRTPQTSYYYLNGKKYTSTYYITTYESKSYEYNFTIVVTDNSSSNSSSSSSSGSAASSSSSSDVTCGTVSMKSDYTSTTDAVRINWNKVNGATGYRIYRYNSSTKKWESIKTIKDGSTTTYRNSGLKAGTTYKYKVKAYKKVNGTNYWGTASATITTSTKPAKITITSASKSKTAVRLNWKKVTGATGYKVQQYKNGKWVTVKTITSGSTTTYKLTGLTKGTSYKFRIRAYRKVNGKTLFGEYSTTKKVTTKS